MRLQSELKWHCFFAIRDINFALWQIIKTKEAGKAHRKAKAAVVKKATRAIWQMNNKVVTNADREAATAPIVKIRKQAAATRAKETVMETVKFETPGKYQAFFLKSLNQGL